MIDLGIHFNLQTGKDNPSDIIHCWDVWCRAYQKSVDCYASVSDAKLGKGVQQMVGRRVIVLLIILWTHTP